MTTIPAFPCADVKTVYRARHVSPIGQAATCGLGVIDCCDRALGGPVSCTEAEINWRDDLVNEGLRRKIRRVQLCGLDWPASVCFKKLSKWTDDQIIARRNPVARAATLHIGLALLD